VGLRPLRGLVRTPGGGGHTSHRGVLGLAFATSKGGDLRPCDARSGAQQPHARDQRTTSCCRDSPAGPGRRQRRGPEVRVGVKIGGSSGRERAATGDRVREAGLCPGHLAAARAVHPDPPRSPPRSLGSGGHCGRRRCRRPGGRRDCRPSLRRARPARSWACRAHRLGFGAGPTSPRARESHGEGLHNCGVRTRARLSRRLLQVTLSVHEPRLRNGPPRSEPSRGPTLRSLAA
jgi:hypothetical protein